MVRPGGWLVCSWLLYYAQVKEITMHNLFFIRRRFPNHYVTIIAVIGVLSCLALGLGVALLWLIPAG
jgi:hypothetical protein